MKSFLHQEFKTKGFRCLHYFMGMEVLRESHEINSVHRKFTFDLMAEFDSIHYMTRVGCSSGEHPSLPINRLWVVSSSNPKIKIVSSCRERIKIKEKTENFQLNPNWPNAPLVFTCSKRHKESTRYHKFVAWKIDGTIC